MAENTKKPKNSKEVKADKKPEVKDKPSQKIASKNPAKEEKVKPAKPKDKESDYNPWNVLKHPHLAEKSMTMVELQNKLTFVVDKRADKAEITEAVEKGFNVRVEKVNVEVTRKGLKKAYVKLSPKSSAADIATRLGMI